MLPYSFRLKGKKMQSVEGEEIGVRGRLAEPQHVGIAALHPEAPSEEEPFWRCPGRRSSEPTIRKLFDSKHAVLHLLHGYHPSSLLSLLAVKHSAAIRKR
ncbi:unnamed protein product [Musa banksii]